MVKQSHYRPGQALRISSQSTNEGGKVVYPSHRDTCGKRRNINLILDVTS